MLKSHEMWGFCKAVIAGGVASAAPVLAFTMALALISLPQGMNGQGDIPATLWFAIMPLVISTSVVFVASVIVGLPVTLILRRYSSESGPAYVGSGVAAGFLIPFFGLLIVGSFAAFWMLILGTLGGAVTSRVWWRYVQARTQMPSNC